MKAPSVAPELCQLELDKADNQRTLKEQLFDWWRFLLPAILKIRLQNCLPRALSASAGTEQPKALRSPVPESPIVGVLQPDANTLLCGAKVQSEALFRSCFLIF